ncbi:MAG: polymer-forming cytoskeletal protein [Planctomycetota bacterium]
MSSRSVLATALGTGARVEGNLHLDHDARIAGEITGRLNSTAHLEIAADAVIHGDVQAASLTVAGQIAGDVAVQHTTELLPGGTIGGTLQTGHLVAAQGAAYNGQLSLHQLASTADSTKNESTPAILLNRDKTRRRVAPEVTKPSGPSDPGFSEIPGAVHAGIRPRRRVPQAS